MASSTADDDPGMFESIVAAQGLNEAQETCLIEVLLLLKYHRRLKGTRFWSCFQQEYKHNFSCKSLKVKTMNGFLVLIKDFVQCNGDIYSLTSLGDRVVSLLTRSASKCETPAESSGTNHEPLSKPLTLETSATPMASAQTVTNVASPSSTYLTSTAPSNVPPVPSWTFLHQSSNVENDYARPALDGTAVGTSRKDGVATPVAVADMEMFESVVASKGLNKAQENCLKEILLLLKKYGELKCRRILVEYRTKCQHCPSFLRLKPNELKLILSQIDDFVQCIDKHYSLTTLGNKVVVSFTRGAANTELQGLSFEYKQTLPTLTKTSDPCQEPLSKSAAQQFNSSGLPSAQMADLIVTNSPVSSPTSASSTSSSNATPWQSLPQPTTSGNDFSCPSPARSICGATKYIPVGLPLQRPPTPAELFQMQAGMYFLPPRFASNVATPGSHNQSSPVRFFSPVQSQEKSFSVVEAKTDPLPKPAAAEKSKNIHGLSLVHNAILPTPLMSIRTGQVPLPKSGSLKEITASNQKVQSSEKDTAASLSKFDQKVSNDNTSVPGGEPFLLETDFTVDLDVPNKKPSFVSRERLEAMALVNIDLIADQGEFVTPRRVEQLLLQQLKVRRIEDVKLRRIEDLKAVFELSRKIGQVNAHITASVAIRNVNTLSDIMEGLRDGIPDKKTYDTLKIGPITKNPHVQKIFSVPSGCEVVEISCVDVYNHLRNFVRENTLWKVPVDIQKFMEYLKEKYEQDDIYSLGVKIKSLALCMQVMKRAQRQEGEISRSYISSVEDDLKKDIRSAYENFRTKIMFQSDGHYTAREHYLSQEPRDVVMDVLNKFQLFLDTVRDLGCHSLDADSKALANLKNGVGKSKVVKELFKFAVIVSNDQATESIGQFLYNLSQEKRQSSEKIVQLKKIPRIDIAQRLVLYFERCYEHADAGLTMKVLRDMEKKCCQHFKRDSFTDLGHEPFLEFLLCNDQICKTIEDNGGVHIGSGAPGAVASIYRPNIHDVIDLILPCEMKTVEKIESIVCHHYRVDSYKQLGIGPAKLALERLEKMKNKVARNVISETSICHDSKVIGAYLGTNGVFGPQSIDYVIAFLQSCPLLGDLSQWTQWDMVFGPQHGSLKSFVEKHGGSRTITVNGEHVKSDILGLELEPGVLCRITSETSDDHFRDAVSQGDPGLVCGHLVSLVACRGFKCAGLALLSNIVSVYLHSINAKTTAGGSLVSGTNNPAIVFTRDCLCKLPLKMCEKLADDIFLAPLSRVVGATESKRLLAASCESLEQENRIIVLGHLLGINMWTDLFKSRMDVRRALRNRAASEFRDDSEILQYESPIESENDDSDAEPVMEWLSSEDDEYDTHNVEVATSSREEPEIERHSSNEMTNTLTSVDETETLSNVDEEPLVKQDSFLESPNIDGSLVGIELSGKDEQAVSIHTDNTAFDASSQSIHADIAVDASSSPLMDDTAVDASSSSPLMDGTAVDASSSSPLMDDTAVDASSSSPLMDGTVVDASSSSSLMESTAIDTSTDSPHDDSATITASQENQEVAILAQSNGSVTTDNTQMSELITDTDAHSINRIADGDVKVEHSVPIDEMVPTSATLSIEAEIKSEVPTQEIQADMNPREKECKRVIESIRRDEFGCGVVLDDTARTLINKQHSRLERSLKRLSHDLYTKDTHFVLELVQNADDNSYDDMKQKFPSLHFVIESGRIIILNNEDGFSERNVRALCDVGNSTKPKHKFGYIGQKGIGFKSVFRITDRPEIHSNGYHFCFDMNNDAMGYILPGWIDDYETDDKWMTRIVLPLRSLPDENVQSLTNRFRDIHPSLLLFLHRLKSITIENKTDGSKLRMVRRDYGKRIIEIRGNNKRTDRWLVQRQRLDVSKLAIQIKGGVEVDETEIALAFPLLDDITQVPEKQSVFAFLPLRGYGFRFVIQGDFDLPSSREDLDSDSSWNQWLRKEIAPTFVAALDSFKSFDENPIKAVKHYMCFITREDEIMDFFKPVAREIFNQLASRPFLPSDDVDTEWKLPSQLVLCSDNFIRQTFSSDLLMRHLNISFIHADVVTESNRTLLMDLGVKPLKTSDLVHIIRAMCLDWSSKIVNDEIIAKIAKILVCIQRSVDDLDLQDETLDAIRDVALIPDCKLRLLALRKEIIFFPFQSGGKNDFGHKLSGDLNMVHPAVMNLLDNVSNSQVVDILEKLGVKRITPNDVIKHHILPAFATDQWKSKDRQILHTYVVLLHEYQDIVTSVIAWEDLADIIQLSTNHGMQNPSRQAIHFTTNYSNPIDLQSVFPSYKWTLLDQYSQRGHSTESWRTFFSRLGVLDFIAVRKVSKSISYKDMEDSAWNNCQSIVANKVGNLTIIDWASEELDALVKSAIDSPSKTSYQEMKKLFRLIGAQFPSLYSKFQHAELREENDVRCHTVSSSFAHVLLTSPWLPGCKENLMGTTTILDYQLKLPSELYICNSNTKALLDINVTYLDLEVDVRSFQEFISFLKIRDGVSCEQLREYFLSWCQTDEKPFVTNNEHMSRVYTFFGRYMTRDNLDELFCRHPSIFIPDSTAPTAPTGLLVGHFYPVTEVCWEDPGNLFAKYSEELKDGPVKPIKTLCEYRGLYHNKPHPAISDQPSLVMYRDLLEFICTYHPDCTDRLDDVIQIYLILARGLHFGSPSGRDWTKELANRRIVPTKRNKYVQTSDHPMISDDVRLGELFNDCDDVHFLELVPKAKRGKSKVSKPQIQNSEHELLMRFFREILGVKSIAECVSEMVITEGLKPWPDLQNYFHDTVPTLQRFLRDKHEDVYERLVEIDFRTQLAQFKFYSVGKLEAVYTMKHSIQTVRTEERECHIHENNVNVQMKSMGNDLAIQKAMAEYFSFGDQNVTGAITIFLMTVYPKIAQRYEINDLRLGKEYKLKALPVDEDEWQIAEAIVYKPPTPEPPVLPPQAQPSTQVDADVLGADAPGEVAAPLLRSWPPPAPNSESRHGSGNAKSSGLSYPKPPKPDGIDELPEKLRKKIRSENRDVVHGETSTEMMGNKDNSSENTALRNNNVRREETNSVMPSCGKTSTDIVHKASSGPPGQHADVEHAKSHPKGIGAHAPPANKPSPHEVTLADFIPDPEKVPLTEDKESLSRNEVVRIGPAPISQSNRESFRGPVTNPQTVRLFVPDEISDIPDERVTYETGNQADVTQYVQIRLDMASDQKDIGRSGEEVVYKYLLARRGKPYNILVPNSGDSTKSDEETIVDVKWLNELRESGFPYDIEVKTKTNVETEAVHYVEVKATMSDSKMYFETSANEITFARNCGENYDLYRVFNVGNAEQIKLIKLRNVADGLDKRSIRVFMVV